MAISDFSGFYGACRSLRDYDLTLQLNLDETFVLFNCSSLEKEGAFFCCFFCKKEGLCSGLAPHLIQQNWCSLDMFTDEEFYDKNDIFIFGKLKQCLDLFLGL